MVSKREILRRFTPLNDIQKQILIIEEIMWK